MQVIINILLWIWQFPQAIVGLLMYPFLGKKVLVADRHHNKCWMGERMSGGISLGPYSYISPYQYLMHPEAIKHECDGHTVQSKIFGPLYLLVIGLPSLIHAWLQNPYKSCYYDYWTERWANKEAGLGVDEKCNLVDLN